MDAVPFLVQVIEGTGSDPGSGKRWLHSLREYAMRRRGDVMLMGECNVAKEEVPSFFEDHGDALHLQLAFLINQRLWLALARGEAAPLEDLIRDLPVPPHDCGWATFLRNHDELRSTGSRRPSATRCSPPSRRTRTCASTGTGSAGGPRRCSAATVHDCAWRGRCCSRCPARP